MNNSVMKVIILMEELACFGKSVTLKELARSAKLDKATAFRLLSSLREKGFVQQIGDQRLYGLGPAPVFVNEAVVGSLAIIGPLERLKQRELSA